MASFFGGFLGGAVGGTVGSAVVRLLLDTRQYQAELARTKAQTEAGLSAQGAAFARFSTVAKAGLLAAVPLVAAGIKTAVQAASDLGEATNKARVTFGSASAEVLRFAETSAESFGIAKAQALEAASGFGAMLQTAGLAEDQAATMSTQLVQLAADMASFNNQDPSEMLERLRSGLAGEAEPLRRFGVFISEARVKAEAYRSGIAEVGAELTDAQKVQARYNIILQDTAKQQGDFARTVGESLPNQFRVLRAELIDTAAEVGEALLPAILELVKAFRGVLEVAGPVLRFLGDLIGLAARLAGALLDPVGALREFQAEWDRTMGLIATGQATTEQVAAAMRRVGGSGRAAAAGLTGLVRAQIDAAARQRAMNAESARWTGLAARYGAATRGAADETRGLAAAHREAAGAAREQRLAELALTDPFFAVLDAANQVGEAQAKVNELQRRGRTDSKAYRDAVVDLLQAQVRLEEAINEQEGSARRTAAAIRDLGRDLRLPKDVIRELVARFRELNRQYDAFRAKPDIHKTVKVDFDFSGKLPFLPAQHGFHGLVTRPTLFLAGERGPERVDVTPGRGGATAVSVAGIDYDRLARAVARAMREARVDVRLERRSFARGLDREYAARGYR